MIRTSRRTFLAASASLAATPALAQTRRSDALSRAFVSPPDSAKPRVWWHWMNGNITREGIAQDLAWMKRVGIGGLQNFDAALATPQVVDRRLVYMTPEWKEAFRYAVRRADELDLEFAIASSPGWSQTGGPWVELADGMKKLVWSETIVDGGTGVEMTLPSPPRQTGPFQTIENQGAVGLRGEGYYADVTVLAYPAPGGATLSPQRAWANDAPFDPALVNSDISTGIPFPRDAEHQEGVVRLDYGRAQTVRSVTICALNITGAPFGGATAARVEASADGRSWRAIGEADLGTTSATLSFAPVRARHFRVTVFGRPSLPLSALGVAPGADIAGMIASVAHEFEQPPPRLAQLEFSSAARVNAFEKKAGWAMAHDYFELDDYVGEDVEGVAPSAVLDISAHMDAEGRLNWTPPRGRWKIVRLGYSLIGKRNHPAPPEATGLEVDKYDAAAVERYINTYLDMYREAAGADMMGRRGIRALLTDSTEVGPANWTPRLLEHFQRLRGYDPKPWLPALVGEIIGTRAESDQFLFDFRATLAELHASEHYGTIARVAHERGLIVYGESLDGGRVTFGDDLDMRAHADIPMSAMWSYADAPRPQYVADGRGAASIAHLKGRTYVACESLTALANPWGHAPRQLQPMIDTIFLTGVNRPVIHTSAHQPTERAPGVSLSIFGQYFNRHDTWAEMAGPWVDYMTRCSHLLQQGRNVADVAYFYGEDTPIGPQVWSDGLPTDAPTRYAYDFVSAQSLLTLLSVRNGDLVSEGGARYKALYLNPYSRNMTLPVLRKLADFVAAGATVVGDAPQASPSLRDNDAEFAQIVQRLWSGAPVTNVGHGRVFAGRDIEAALQQIGVAPAMSYSEGVQSELQFVHRALDDGEIYFVSNRTDEHHLREVRFRSAGKAAQFWRAETGAIEEASYRFDGPHTAVAVELEPHQSVFVVFRENAIVPERRVSAPAVRQIAEINGAWQVAFQEGRGAPAAITLAALTSLTEHSDPGVKYFSGLATYTKTFDLAARPSRNERLWLDLGELAEIAEVRVNGRVAGIVWKSPNRIEITSLARRGANRLEVRVANLWVNRLIGDQQPGAEKVAFTITPTFTSDAPLRPSGLIGPVTLWST